MTMTHGTKIGDIMKMIVPEESMEEAGAMFDRVNPSPEPRGSSA